MSRNVRPELVAKVIAAVRKDPDLEHGLLAERFGVSKATIGNAIRAGTSSLTAEEFEANPRRAANSTRRKASR